MTPRRRDTVFADKLWNRFKGDPDKPYMFQPRVKQGIDEKILARVVASQIEPEIRVTSKPGGRHPAASGAAVDGIVRPGDLPQTPEHERQLVRSMFPKGLGSSLDAASRSETKVIRRALEATASIGIGNPLLQDQRVSIKYA